MLSSSTSYRLYNTIPPSSVSEGWSSESLNVKHAPQRGLVQPCTSYFRQAASLPEPLMRAAREAHHNAIRNCVDERVSQLVKTPTIQSVSAFRGDRGVCGILACFRSRDFCTKFLGQSEVIVLFNLVWLQQASNFTCSCTFCILRSLLRNLTVFSEQLCVIA